MNGQPIGTVELFGNEFPVHWVSTDRSEIANREKCYRLSFFDRTERVDRDTLRQNLPQRIQKCWIQNPNYERDGYRELIQWQERADWTGLDLPAEALINGFYVPPEARGLPVITAHNAGAGTDLVKDLVSGQRVLAIIREAFYNGGAGPSNRSIIRFTPGILAFRATFAAGEVLYLRGVSECSIPPEAFVYWQSFAIEASLQQMQTRTEQLEEDLATKSAELEKAQYAAALTLEEALKQWMRFDPLGMRADTKGRIQKAVQLYITDPDKRSLSKIAKEFGVTKKTVSIWFKQFYERTGFRVVTHIRHESLHDKLQAEVEDKRRQEGEGEHRDDEEAG